MPRYASGSLEKAIYADLKREARGLSTRRNSSQSRAHRLESLHETDMSFKVEPEASYLYHISLTSRELDILRELIRNHANLDPNDGPEFFVDSKDVSPMEWAKLILKV